MEQVSDSAELWRLTLEHSPVGMALVALDGRLTTANRALCDMLGHSQPSLCRRGFQELTHPDDLPADLELFHRTLAGEIDSYRVRKRYLHTDGRVVWGDLSVALVRTPDGRPLHFIAQVLDVTEQRDFEELLQQAHAETEHERQTLEAIFETVRVGLLLIDRDGRYERMNRRHRETMALPFPDGHEGAAGQLGEVFHLDGRPMAREEMPSYRAAAGEEFDDYTYWVGSGASRAAFSTSARQVRGPSGEPLGAALAYQEVTDLIRAVEIKEQFVSSVSHELRTPLTTVLGHLEMLCEDERLPADAVRRLGVAQRNAERLRALVSDLLFVAGAREGALEVVRAPVDLAELVGDAVSAIGPAAAAGEVTVRLDAPPRVAVEADAHRLRQVVDNLLSNAVKYTEPGGEVAVAVGADSGTVRLRVHDTGIGIAPDELDQVFGRFFRGEQALRRHIPGTGIGLDIVRAIVEAHGGRVRVESTPGRGTTFEVHLPEVADVAGEPA